MGPDTTACAKDMFFPFSIYVYWNKTIQSYNHACSDSCICCLITCLIDISVSYRFLDFFMSRTCLDFQICMSCMKEASSCLECTLDCSLTNNRLHPGRMGGTLIFLGPFCYYFFNELQAIHPFPAELVSYKLLFFKLARPSHGHSFAHTRFCWSLRAIYDWNDLNTVLHIKQLHSLRQKSVKSVKSWPMAD